MLRCLLQEDCSGVLRTKDGIFSKVLAIAATGFLTWFLTAIRLIPFNALTCAAVTNPMCSYLFFPSSKGIKRKDRMFSS